MTLSLTSLTMVLVRISILFSLKVLLVYSLRVERRGQRCRETEGKKERNKHELLGEHGKNVGKSLDEGDLDPSGDIGVPLFQSNVSGESARRSFGRP